MTTQHTSSAAASVAAATPAARGLSLSQRERIRSAIRSVVVIAIALICAVPLYVVVINTFKNSGDMAADPFGLPTHFTLENYTYAMENLP
ncbi:multiple sugar-binding transport system permease [Bifidobacterium saguini DSM 23967]|nr:hypothetical protein [Bifidobacterium saguini]KFI92112.1 multiple sugar-binding transport system permease [Bifidobacterium saguini DSM 23967]